MGAFKFAGSLKDLYWGGSREKGEILYRDYIGIICPYSLITPSKFAGYCLWEIFDNRSCDEGLWTEVIVSQGSADGR